VTAAQRTDADRREWLRRNQAKRELERLERGIPETWTELRAVKSLYDKRVLFKRIHDMDATKCLLRNSQFFASIPEQAAAAAPPSTIVQRPSACRSIDRTRRVSK
jgi:hypothetical protein